MGTICLSPAPNLRCVGLSLTEEIITLVPVALEVIFSLGLALTGRDAGRIRFILVAESPIYLFLTILSLLNRIAPLFQTSLLAHKILDILIGVASFIPILLFMLYLYLFKRSKFFPHLPKRFTLLANSFALLVIPVIVVTNEIVSFLGIKYREVPIPENHVVGDEIALGPDMSSFQFGSEFLRSTSLALLVIYEAATFLVFFIRLASCVLAQNNIEDRAAYEWEGIMFRGLGWLVIGAKISAVETAIGFATMSFGVMLTRRILRLIGRACIIIGVIKGPDRKEEFLILDTDKANEFQGTRKLRLSGGRTNISSPRLLQSTMARRLSQMTSLRRSRANFPTPQPISPIASANVQSPASSRKSSIALLNQPTLKPPAKFRPAPIVLERKSTESHVSVVRSIGRAPTLVLRLSPMNLPSGDLLAKMSAKWTDTATINFVGADSIPLSPRSAPLPRFAGDPLGLLSGFPESDGTRNSERSRSGRSRRSSLPPGVFLLPSGISPSHTPQPSPREPFVWPSQRGSEPEPELELEPTSAAAESMAAAIARRRSSRSRRTGSTSSFGDMSIDWIVPESSTTPGRFKGIGTAPIRTTQTPTSASVLRSSSSAAVERQEELPRERQGGGGGGSRRERARRDSGVLGMDDLARVRRSMQAMI